MFPDIGLLYFGRVLGGLALGLGSPPAGVYVSEVSSLYSTALYCIVLYCTVMYCIVLYCIALYCTVLYCTVLYCTVL